MPHRDCGVLVWPLWPGRVLEGHSHQLNCRPEPHISIFDDARNLAKSVLPDVEASVIEEDLRLYIPSELVREDGKWNPPCILWLIALTGTGECENNGRASERTIVDNEFKITIGARQQDTASAAYTLVPGPALASIAFSRAKMPIILAKLETFTAQHAESLGDKFHGFKVISRGVYVSEWGDCRLSAVLHMKLGISTIFPGVSSPDWDSPGEEDATSPHSVKGVSSGGGETLPNIHEDRTLYPGGVEACASDEALLQAALSSFRIFLRFNRPIYPFQAHCEDSWKVECTANWQTACAEAELAGFKAECSRAEWEACRLAEEKREAEAPGKQLREGESLEIVNSTEDPGSTQQLNAMEDPTRRGLTTGGSPTAPSPIIAREPFVASEEDSRISRHWEDIHLVDSSFLSLPENISSPSSTGTTLHRALALCAHRLPAGVPQPPSLTASIFGRGLTPPARILALLKVIGPLVVWKAPGIRNVESSHPLERRANVSEEMRQTWVSVFAIIYKDLCRSLDTLDVAFCLFLLQAAREPGVP
ncbi:hypothetical protein BS47DRAFT_1392016 [Hydnum rufescens UP504]|uniref:Uncharacterized protein n=1 Tax=Hydnum rufescens UP504 TaxID=1448309 RepID=A0A9P6DXJ6_9AGAM|nr:hypothetical protein BS47DRAFT_1392016 [Hydnum rufescens UP504]